MVVEVRQQERGDGFAADTLVLQRTQASVEDAPMQFGVELILGCERVGDDDGGLVDPGVEYVAQPPGAS